mmetsp:Transcript_17751/g.39741  ORF Transcript_17751/g.39741 Transcript_17751/m.39741 type:complete len:170 (+) Transcript_17751:690-1199(+)
MRSVSWELVGDPDPPLAQDRSSVSKIPYHFGPPSWEHFVQWLWAQPSITALVSAAAKRNVTLTIGIVTHGNLLESVLPRGLPHAQNTQCYAGTLSVPPALPLPMHAAGVADPVVRDVQVVYSSGPLREAETGSKPEHAKQHLAGTLPASHSPGVSMSQWAVWLGESFLV